VTSVSLWHKACPAINTSYAPMGLPTGSRAGIGEFDGAFLLVLTLDPATGFTTLLPSLGKSKMTFDPAMGGKGIYYSTCWIKNSLPTAGYKILSFHEIPQP
jgi:hypothetical protein